MSILLDSSVIGKLKWISSTLTNIERENSNLFLLDFHQLKELLLSSDPHVLHGAYQLFQRFYELSKENKCLLDQWNLCFTQIQDSLMSSVKSDNEMAAKRQRMRFYLMCKSILKAQREGNPAGLFSQQFFQKALNTAQLLEKEQVEEGGDMAQLQVLKFLTAYIKWVNLPSLFENNVYESIRLALFQISNLKMNSVMASQYLEMLWWFLMRLNSNSGVGPDSYFFNVMEDLYATLKKSLFDRLLIGGNTSNMISSETIFFGSSIKCLCQKELSTASFERDCMRKTLLCFLDILRTICHFLDVDKWRSHFFINPVNASDEIIFELARKYIFIFGENDNELFLCLWELVEIARLIHFHNLGLSYGEVSASVVHFAFLSFLESIDFDSFVLLDLLICDSKKSYLLSHPTKSPPPYFLRVCKTLSLYFLFFMKNTGFSISCYDRFNTERNRQQKLLGRVNLEKNEPDDLEVGEWSTLELMQRILAMLMTLRHTAKPEEFEQESESKRELEALFYSINLVEEYLESIIQQQSNESDCEETDI